MHASKTVIRTRPTIVALLLFLAACGGATEPDDPPVETGKPDSPPAIDTVAQPVTEPPDEIIESPTAGDLLPMPFRAIWEPWHGDFDGMVERRIVRAVVPFGGYQFYYQDGLPRGASWELLQRLEQYINDKMDRGNVKVYVVAIPVNRDKLISSVLDGHADLVAADLTVTTQRGEQIQFSRPMLTNIDEVIVTGPATAPIESLDDLAGREIVVRKSSSYFEHLQALLEAIEGRGLEPPTIRAADEILEAEDLLEMVNGGIIDVTVMDDYKARFWAGVFPDIVVRDDLVINEGGSIAWAVRNETPQLAAVIQEFLRKYGKGSMIGNDTYNRYLSDASRVRCSYTKRPEKEMNELVTVFQKYGEEFDFDWLMLAAQGQQESGRRCRHHADQAVDGRRQERRHR